MKKANRTHVWILITILFSFLLQSSVLASTKVMVIGDSWGDGLSDPLDKQFEDHGHGDWDVVNFAVSGSTADVYANNVGGVLDATLTALATTPSIEVVFISLGGNDLFGGYISQGTGIFNLIEDDLRLIVSQIISVRPDVDILFSGYDILKFDKSNFCLAFAFSQFGVIYPWEVMPLFIEIGQRQQNIADDFVEVTHLDLFGTGQGNPGAPNILEWSPSSYIAESDEDCLHLSDSGHYEFTKAMYCRFFAPRFSETCTPLNCNIATGTIGRVRADHSAIGTLLFIILLPIGAVYFWKCRMKGM